MAHTKIETGKDGVLKAKIQVYGRDFSTGERRLFSKRIYNSDNLTESKFRKYVEKEAMAFEATVTKASEEQLVSVQTHVLTFNELFQEWLANIRANYSLGYYRRAKDVERVFIPFLKQRGLYDKPISEITVRDMQLFFNSFSTKTYTPGNRKGAYLKKTLPKYVNFRELEREGILATNASYHMNHEKTNVTEEAARRLCERYGLKFNEYFDVVAIERNFAVATVKGHRTILRAVFNEAVRYDWITKNPVCRTKIGAGNSNVNLRPVPEKEVFTFQEAQHFLEVLDDLPKKEINKKVSLKILLLTGVRYGELNGLRWSDIDFEKRVIHVRRNRLYSPLVGTYEKTPKTRTSVRDIPIATDLLEDLKEYQEWFRTADDAFDSKLDEYYLVVGDDRQPLTNSVLRHWLKSIEQKNGLKPVCCHGLRHTYCSLLLSQNVPIQTVSRYMGHSDSTITLKVYSHFIADTQEKALYALDALTKKCDNKT